jgi:hypothetical protein
MQFQRRRFLEIDQSKTRIACGNLVSDWSISKKSSTMKQLGKMDRNVVGGIYGRSSMGIAHSVLIWNMAVIGN